MCSTSTPHTARTTSFYKLSAEMQREAPKCTCFINSNSLVGARKVAPGNTGAHTTPGINKQKMPLESAKYKCFHALNVAKIMQPIWGSLYTHSIKILISANINKKIQYHIKYIFFALKFKTKIET
jgi:hypothetical protein